MNESRGVSCGFTKWKIYYIQSFGWKQGGETELYYKYNDKKNRNIFKCWNKIFNNNRYWHSRKAKNLIKINEISRTAYVTRVALPVYEENGAIERYNVFRAILLVRHAEDGKMYLYDIMNIKKETSTHF